LGNLQAISQQEKEAVFHMQMAAGHRNDGIFCLIPHDCSGWTMKKPSRPRQEQEVLIEPADRHRMAPLDVS
jgi:hypothetical protein